MRKRSALIGLLISLMPISPALMLKYGILFTSSTFALPLKVNAESPGELYKNGLKKVKETKDYKGAIEDFTKAIEKAFAGRQGQGDHRLVPSVSKGYNAPSVSKKLTIDATKSINEVSPEGKKLKTDLDIFTYLVGVKPMTFGVGFGEVAIYWLFNYKLDNRGEDGLIKKELLKLNQGGNEPDLKFASGPANIIEALCHLGFESNVF